MVCLWARPQTGKDEDGLCLASILSLEHQNRAICVSHPCEMSQNAIVIYRVLIAFWNKCCTSALAVARHHSMHSATKSTGHPCTYRKCSHGLQSCSRHHFQSTCLTKSTSSLTAKMAPGTNNDGAGDSVENEDFEYEQGNDPKQSQRMLETLGIINVATKSKRVSAANALGFPSKRQKKDESALQKRAPRGQGPNARERIHRGTSDACDEKKEAEENVVAKGDEGAHDGFNEDNAQDGGEGRVRVRGRGGRGRGGTRGRGRNRGRSYGTTGSGRGRGRGRRVDADTDADTGGTDADDGADGRSLGGEPSTDPEELERDEDPDDGEEEAYNVEENDDDEDSAVDDDEEEEEEGRKATPGRGRGRGGRRRGAASESGSGRRGRGGRGQNRSRGQGFASQGQGTAGGSAVEEGAAEASKKPSRRQGQQQAKRRGVDPAAAAAVDDIEMPSEVELQDIWRMLASEPESVVSAEGILRVANQLGLSDYEPLVGPMMEFAREKVPGLSPNSTALSFHQFRRMLEALYNPQLPGEQPPQLQPELQQRGVQPEVERQKEEGGTAVAPLQASVGPETAGAGVLWGMDGDAGAGGVVMAAAVSQIDGTAEKGS